MLRVFPLTLLLTLFASAQTSPKAFLKDLDEAQAKSQARDWAAAVPLWQRVVTANPNEGFFFYSLGVAQYNTARYRDAVASFEKAFELGVGRRSVVAFEIARSHAMLKEKDATLNALQRALDLGFRSRDRIRQEEAFTFLRNDARFKSFAGEVDTKRMSRTEGWRYDVSFLAAEIKRMHYWPFHKISEARFNAAVERLQADIPRLSDNEITVRMMRLMALIGDGHTGMFPDLLNVWNGAPVRVDLFQEGLFIIAADPKYADLVGKQIVRIGKDTPEQVVAKLGPIISKDSPQAITRSAGWYIRYPQILNGLGIQSQSNTLELTVRNSDGTTRSIALPTAPTPPDFNRIFASPSWISAFDATPGPLPLYLKDRRTNYWFEELPNKVLYFQFNLVVNAEKESLSAFLERLFKYVDEHKIEKLIIDMRWNNGGNEQLGWPLIDGLIRHDRINQRGNLFAIVGRYTFSAAPVVASRIESRTQALLVGEPTPSGPNVIAESNIVTLPYSQYRVSISDVYHQTTWSGDSRQWLAPVFYVPVTFAAYKAKRDSAMETIFSYLNQ